MCEQQMCLCVYKEGEGPEKLILWTGVCFGYRSSVRQWVGTRKNCKGEGSSDALCLIAVPLCVPVGGSALRPWSPRSCSRGFSPWVHFLCDFPAPSWLDQQPATGALQQPQSSPVRNYTSVIVLAHLQELRVTQSRGSARA